MERRGVHERDDNHPPRDIGGRQALGQFAQRHRAFVFVTVVTAGKQRGRTLTALNHRDRNHHRAPGRVVPGVRQFEEPVLHAFAGKIHRGADRVVRQVAHGSILHEQLAWHVAQRLDAGFGDQNAFGDF